jgi:hypothetical protein
MKATYKKRVVVGHGLHTGPIIATQDVQLEIHYEAEDFNTPPSVVKCDLNYIGPSIPRACMVYLSDTPCKLSTLKLVIEEVADGPGLR